MRAPLLIPAPDLAQILRGDPQAVADSISAIYTTMNQLSALIANRVGLWQDVAFDATNFTTNGTGSITVDAADQQDFSFMRIDDMLIINLSLVGITINNGTTTEIRVKAPGGFVLKGSHGVRSGNTVWNNPATAETGALFVQGAGSFISLQRWDGIAAAGYPFTGVANDFNIGFFGIFQILPTPGN